MRIKVTLEFDAPIPDDVPASDVRQLVYDEIIRACVFYHLETALDIAKIDFPHLEVKESSIKTHQDWGKAIDKAKMTIGE